MLKSLERALVLAVILAAPLAAADSDAKVHNRAGLSLGGRGMYFQAKDSSSGDWSGGAQVRVGLGRVIALEGSADYRQTTFPGTRVDTYPVQASLLAYLAPDWRVSPFLLAGAGWYFTHVEGPLGFESTSNRFGPHAGGGLQMFLTRRWSIDGTYRYVWAEDVRARNLTNIRDQSFSDQGHMITGALNFHF